jgi:hypothetical protein
MGESGPGHRGRLPVVVLVTPPSRERWRQWEGRLEHATWTVRILIVVIGGAILYKILSAHKGVEMRIRRIPGISAIDEAVGRATEMGRPVLFCPGVGGLEINTFAALAVLGRVARQAAKYGIRVFVPVMNAAIYPIAEEVVREAYQAEGRVEDFRPDDVRFFSERQDAFASATSGLIERERIAAQFLFGGYGYESLILAETGQRIGAIQVAATDSIFQVPFFICACDYTMIGEELFAASAYLSRDPTMLGSLVGQDIGKIVIMAIVLIGFVVTTIWTATTRDMYFNWLIGILNR